MTRLLGCLAMLGVVALCAALAAFFYVVRPAKEIATHLQEASEALQQVRSLEAEVESSGPFTPPEGSGLSEEQLARFVGVQEAVMGAAEADIAGLRAKYDELKALESGTRSLANPVALALVVEDLARSLLAAKRVQVSALNEHGFSLSEYRWVQKAALASLGVEVLPVDLSSLRSLDLESIRALGRRAMGNVETVSVPPSAAAGSPDLEAYREQLDVWALAALMGL